MAEVDGELLGVGDLRGDLHGEVGLVLAGEHAVGHLVEDLRQLGGVVLADGEDDGLADLPADRIAQGVFQEGLAEELVGGVGEEALLELALLEGLLLVFAGIVGERDDEALFGKQFGGDLGAGIHHRGVDQVAFLHAVEQRVAVGGLAVLAAEGAVGVQQQSALGFARVAGGGLGLVEPLEVVAGRGGEAELVADEVVEDGAGVAADGAVGFVGNDQVEIGRREEPLVLVVEEQRLHRGDDDFRPPPVVAVLLVDHRLKVGGQQRREGLLGLILQFEAIHQKQHAPGIAGTEEELDDGGGGEGLAGAGGHLEQEAVFAVLHGPLQGVNGLQLIGPQETQFVGLDVAGALGLVAPRRFGLVVRALGQHDVVVADLVLDEALRVGRDLLVADHRVRRREGRNEVGVAALQVPEVVQVAVGEDDEAAVLGLGVFAGLLLADERVLVLRFGLKDDEREAFGVEQQEVDEALARLLEVVAKGIQIG